MEKKKLITIFIITFLFLTASHIYYAKYKNNSKKKTKQVIKGLAIGGLLGAGIGAGIVAAVGMWEATHVVFSSLLEAICSLRDRRTRDDDHAGGDGLALAQ